MLQRSNLPPPPALKELGEIALFLDFDGTLVGIASGPDAIAVPERLGKSLEELARRLDGALAIVTGRSIDNLISFLGDVSVHLAGSHGGHVLSAEGAVLRETTGLPGEVKDGLADYAKRAGILYEKKTHGAALHYRAKPEAEAEVRRFAEDLAGQHQLATKSGKCVIEIVRPGIDKGGAVELLAGREPFAGKTAIFVGDDVTDEDGFVACNQLGGFGIQIGQRTPTQARYRLSSVGDLHEWLQI